MVSHAESDLTYAKLGQAEPAILRNQVTFHAQQAAEKAVQLGKQLKAVIEVGEYLEEVGKLESAHADSKTIAAKAKKEGLIQVSNIFAETAEQERVHAKNFFRFLEGGMVEITAAYPAGAWDALDAVARAAATRTRRT